MEAEEQYRILLANDWRLTDLYEFPHAYAQTYAFIYCLDSELPPRDRERIELALKNYPWRGGYSYVNIYFVLQNQVPIRDRPKIRSIYKASPGWLDLLLNVDVAIDLAKAVAALSAAAVSAAVAYKKISKTLGEIKIERKRLALQDMQLTEGQAKTINAMCAEMATFLGFKSLRQLHEQTGNPEITLKLLLAHYRRISVIVDYVAKGKVDLPEAGHDKIMESPRSLKD